VPLARSTLQTSAATIWGKFPLLQVIGYQMYLLLPSKEGLQRSPMYIAKFWLIGRLKVFCEK
jgi:hypothetical protein